MLVKRKKKADRRDPREEKFLLAFFGEGESAGNPKLAAIEAGYDENKAESVGLRTIRELNKRQFQKVLEAAGITKVYVARRIREYIQANSTSREFPTMIRSLLRVMGEIGEDGTPQQNINVTGPGAQVMVIVGSTPDKIKRLKAGNPIVQPEQPNV